MASSYLHPPNSYALSDAIIGDVVERVHPHHTRYDAGNINVQKTHPLVPRDTRGTKISEAKDIISETVASKGSLGLLTQMLPSQLSGAGRGSFIGHKRLPSLDFSPNKKHKHTALDTVSLQSEQTPEPPKTRRERCRINQARYRNKQRKYGVDLEATIQTLKEDIYKLELQRQNIVRCTPTNETVWNVAAEYFRVFRYGYVAPQMGAEASNDIAVLTSPSASHSQLKFLQSTMTSDVTDGSLCGAEQILDNWRRVSLYHQDVNMQLLRLEKARGVEDALIARVSVSLTITENTLKCLYPHLVDNGQRSPLADKLLDQRLVMRGSVYFNWDQSTGRVARLESKVDMLTPMLRLLGNLEDVARVFDGAHIALECGLVVKEE
ncbi:hypothetical protein PHYBOEH_010722 [Phytophthora boehmeriae]|uniref:BZIP transcription factor 1 n=1 Tax=Phytophthora boehmeriae TaxID=109152 RepID=A0A8T1X3Q3_9STRA|nr:hypothetical protein PHYBOEH_010722 [Phytophthora boehmeriae]